MDYTLTYVYIPIHKLGSYLNIIFYTLRCYLFLYAINFELFAHMKVIIYITKQSIYIISYVISNDTTHMIH